MEKQKAEIEQYISEKGGISVEDIFDIVMDNPIKISKNTKLEFNMNNNPKDKQLIEKVAQKKGKFSNIIIYSKISKYEKAPHLQKLN